MMSHAIGTCLAGDSVVRKLLVPVEHTATSRIGSGLVQGHSLPKGTPSQMPGGRTPGCVNQRPMEADGTLAEAHQPGQGVARTIPVPGATGPSQLVRQWRQLMVRDRAGALDTSHATQDRV